MTEIRRTFTSEGRKFLEGQISSEEFSIFFDSFKKNMSSVKNEFEKAVSPALYFNADAKKVTDKNAVFNSIYDDIDRGIRIVSAALRTGDAEKFKKGYATIVEAGDKMEHFQKDISALANSISM